MTRKLKKAIKQGFEVPPPAQKETFLCNIQRPSIGSFEFICLQAAYIRKWIWVFSAMIFAAALIVTEYWEKDILWCVSAFMPLLALTMITECGRSETYGMAEFELSTQFSLKSVVLARFGILGISNLILICVLVPLILVNSKTTMLQTGMYMITPYLLTVFVGLWAVRRVHGKESIYLCTGIAATVSIGDAILYQSFPLLFSEHDLIWWSAAFMILGIGVVNQCYQTIKQTEELAWSL